MGDIESTGKVYNDQQIQCIGCNSAMAGVCILNVELILQQFCKKCCLWLNLLSFASWDIELLIWSSGLSDTKGQDKS